MNKSYVGIVRDHSGSMESHSSLAAKDYNLVIAGLKDAARETDIDTVVSVVKCGVGMGARVEREITLSSVAVLKPLTNYKADGSGTPLWDSVGNLIDIHEGVPDLKSDTVSFLMIIVTDGLENRSKIWSARKLRDKIIRLQGTDRWSFAFRVPRRYAQSLSNELDVPMGNILEWEQTEEGFNRAATATVNSTQSYYQGMARGQRSTTRFFADIGNISPNVIRRELHDISSRVTIWNVTGPTQVVIKAFVEDKSGNPYVKGRAYYELVKTETVQDNKELAIRRRSTGAVYAGHAARDLLSLPVYGSIRLSPGDHGDYEVFIQSTSLNRVLAPGSKLLYITKP